jgi:hypothetical protein
VKAMEVVCVEVTEAGRKAAAEKLRLSRHGKGTKAPPCSPSRVEPLTTEMSARR